MCLIDDDCVVRAQKRVGARLGEQYAVRHELYARFPRERPSESVLVAYERADRALHLVRHALGHRHGREAARLRARHAASPHAAREEALEGHLRELGRLAGSGVAADDHDLAAVQRGEYLVAPRAHRELGRVFYVRRRLALRILAFPVRHGSTITLVPALHMPCSFSAFQFASRKQPCDSARPMRSGKGVP